MSATDYNDLSRHIGHKVEVVTYADTNVAIECEECSEVLLDFDREVACDRPECRNCYPDPKPYNEEDHECENHTWTLQMNIANTPTQNYCEECGATESADPEDVAEQIRLLGENE